MLAFPKTNKSTRRMEYVVYYHANTGMMYARTYATLSDARGTTFPNNERRRIYQKQTTTRYIEVQ